VILDSSAIVSIALKEPDYEVLLNKLLMVEDAAIGAPTMVETAIVLSARLQMDARGLLARFIEEAGITLIPFSDAHYAMAVQAWLRFGKGRHPAALNFGDCLSYAAARLVDQPLLCKGNDFSQTDLKVA